MTSMFRRQLEEAYRLIQQDQLDAAQAILREVVARNPDNADAWWLMANAVTEPRDAYQALSNVLRTNPMHDEAREAFNQLVSEYPDLDQAAMPIPGGIDDFSADITVDIDDLLIKTGSLRADPLTRPAEGGDVSSAYLDDLWGQTAAAPTTDAADLEDLFGSGDLAISSVPNEDDELAKAFGIQAPPPPAQPKSRPEMKTPAAQQADLDALFGGTPAPSAPKSSPRMAAPPPPSMDMFTSPPSSTAEDDLNALFGSEPLTTTEGSAALFEADSFGMDEPLPAFEDDMNAFFDGGASDPNAEMALADDPYAMDSAAAAATEENLDTFFTASPSDEPSFVQAATEESPKKRRRREPKPPAPEMVTVGDEPATTYEPTTVSQKNRTRQIRIEAEAPAHDPFESERKANRRNRTPLFLAVILIAVLIGAFLFLNRPQPTPDDLVTAQLEAAQNDLKANGFEGIKAARTGSVIQLTICGVPGRKLQARVYQAMEIIAVPVAAARDQVQTAQIEVVACGDANVKLYRAAAPIAALTKYIDGGRQDAKTYRTAWQTN
ncbi:MAG: tetratricopeptide repeat protein [Anaerolineales bacterium]|nr:tetratricopeptide repeat protein [Anaerolineales bacterium]